MIERIQLILQTKSLSPGKFADEIGVQRSSVSHILSGRNGPSLDFIQKILKRYTDISASWLVSGEGQMYPGNQALNALKGKATSRSIIPDLFSTEQIDEETTVQKTARTTEPMMKQETLPSPAPVKVAENKPEPVHYKSPERKNETDAGLDVESLKPAVKEPTEPSKEVAAVAEAPKPKENSPVHTMDQAVKAMLFYPDGTFEIYRLRQ